MNNEIRFRMAIAAEPDDDAPRLAYANWLVSQKNPRGEFIRLQLELARMHEDDPGRLQLERRESSLLKKYARAWRDEYPKWARKDTPPAFHRGFPSEIACTIGDWLKGAAALVQRWPVHTVRFRGAAEQLPRLAHSMELLRIRVLDLSYSKLDDNSLTELVNSPHVVNLTGLYLMRSQLKAGAAEAIAGAAESGQTMSSHPHGKRCRGCRSDCSGQLAISSTAFMAKLAKQPNRLPCSRGARGIHDPCQSGIVKSRYL